MHATPTATNLRDERMSQARRSRRNLATGQFFFLFSRASALTCSRRECARARRARARGHLCDVAARLKTRRSHSFFLRDVARKLFCCLAFSSSNHRRRLLSAAFARACARSHSRIRRGDAPRGTRAAAAATKSARMTRARRSPLLLTFDLFLSDDGGGGDGDDGARVHPRMPPP